MARRWPGLVTLPLALAAFASCSGTQPPVPAADNLAQRRPVAAPDGAGSPALVTDGLLAAEGSPPDGAAVLLPRVTSVVVVDLGTPRRIGALLLQAGAGDVYFVEASTDGEAWRVAWRVAPPGAANGLRTLTTRLAPSFAARWLRVRSTTARQSSVAELQAFESEPGAWPALVSTRPDSRLPLWPNLMLGQVEALQAALAVLVLLGAAWSALARGQPAGQVRLRRALLLALAILSGAAWTNFLNFRYSGVVNSWEFYHYYLGAKYLPELGYHGLYECTAAVDRQDGLDLRGQVLRDLRDDSLAPIEARGASLTACRAAFTEQRWAAFSQDVRFFRQALSPAEWQALRRDHGFNGSPTWVLAGGVLAAAPASWPRLQGLALLDFALIVASLLLVGGSFGLEAACLAAGTFGLSSLGVYTWTGGGFLRYDWFFLLSAGLAALRGRRPALAGFALGWATLLRVFPVCLLAGLGLKVVLEACEQRSLAPLAQRRRVAAGALAAALLLGGAPLATLRPGIWGEFLANTTRHAGTETYNMMGLGALLSWAGGARGDLMGDPLLVDSFAPWREARRSAAQAARGQYFAAAAGLVLLLGLAVRRCPDWAAATLGLALLPALPNLSCYYYVSFSLLAALQVLSPAAGLALAAFTWLTVVARDLWHGSDLLGAALSFAALLLAAGLCGLVAWPRRAPNGDEAG